MRVCVCVLLSAHIDTHTHHSPIFRSFDVLTVAPVRIKHLLIVKQTTLHLLLWPDPTKPDPRHALNRRPVSGCSLGHARAQQLEKTKTKTNTCRNMRYIYCTSFSYEQGGRAYARLLCDATGAVGHAVLVVCTNVNCARTKRLVSHLRNQTNCAFCLLRFPYVSIDRCAR